MAKVKFRTSIATFRKDKQEDAYVDSGATHNFFHRRSSFLSYENIDQETVEAANGTSLLLGKGIVWISVNGGMHVEAFHAPHFRSNIVAVGVLSEDFDVLFSSSFKYFHGYFMLPQGSSNPVDVIWETSCSDGLYIMNLRDSSQDTQDSPTPSCSNVSKPSALEWHRKTGHPSTQRYRPLSKVFPDVPEFSTTVLNNTTCVPCLRSKIKRQEFMPRTTSPCR